MMGPMTTGIRGIAQRMTANTDDDNIEVIT